MTRVYGARASQPTGVAKGTSTRLEIALELLRFAMIKKKPERIVIDLSRTTWVDSAGAQRLF